MQSMRVLILSTYPREGMAGATRAAWRLHQGLQEAGAFSRMLVQAKEAEDATVEPVLGRLSPVNHWLHVYMDFLPVLFYRSRQLSATWSVGWMKNAVVRQAKTVKPSVVNLHFVGHGFLPISTLPKLPGPIVAHAP